LLFPSLCAFVAFVVKFLQIWVFSRYLKAARFPFSRLFALLAVEFLKSKIPARPRAVLDPRFEA
jgi:hypothetical protein